MGAATEIPANETAGVVLQADTWQLGFRPPNPLQNSVQH